MAKKNNKKNNKNKISNKDNSVTNLIMVIIVSSIFFTIFFMKRKKERPIQSGFVNNFKPNYKTIKKTNSIKKKKNKEKLVNIVHNHNHSHHYDPSTNNDCKTDKNMKMFQYRDLKAHERIINPLLPPERTYQNSYGIPINIPTREVGQYQQIGALYKQECDTPVVVPLFGRPLFKGCNAWTYYVTSNTHQAIKIPLVNKNKKCDTTYGCEEIQNGDLLTIPEFNGVFKATIYDYDKPQYIPFVY
jgi:hypothetical protein